MKNIALFVVLAATLSSCAVLRGADKALYSAANSVSSRDLITGERGLNFADRQKQIKQGNAAALSTIEKYEKSGKKLNEEINSAQYNRLLSIFGNLHKVSHLRDENWQVIMLPEKGFNAFVTGGTVIFVNYGLMQDLKFDDEIAAVLAHEMAHVTANHVFERQASGLATKLVDSKRGASNLMQASYSQIDESEADKIGVLYMTLAGYDPAAAARIWKNIYDKRGANGQLVTTHPMSSKRYKANLATGKKVKQYLIPGKVNPNYSYILENNSLFKKSAGMASERQPGQGAGIAAVAETALGFLKQNVKAKQNAAQEVTRVKTLKQIESKMQIKGADKKSSGDIILNVKYAGTKPIDNLAIKAVSENGQSIYRHNGVIGPNQIFDASFSGDILPADGSKPKMKLVVDEANYLN